MFIIPSRFARVSSSVQSFSVLGKSSDSKISIGRPINRMLPLLSRSHPLQLPTGAPVPPSVFYSQSARNRLVTPPPNAPFRPVLPYQTKYLATTASPLRYMRDSANYHLAQETSGSFLGAMKLQQFLNRFLPSGQDEPMSELERSCH